MPSAKLVPTQGVAPLAEGKASKPPRKNPLPPTEKVRATPTVEEWGCQGCGRYNWMTRLTCRQCGDIRPLAPGFWTTEGGQSRPAPGTPGNSGPSYTEPTATLKAVRDDSPRGITTLPEWPEASWWNERLCHRRGEMCQTSWGGWHIKRPIFNIGSSINQSQEKKQHVKIWVKRYPKDTGVPSPAGVHDWVKTSPARPGRSSRAMRWQR